MKRYFSLFGLLFFISSGCLHAQDSIHFEVIVDNFFYTLPAGESDLVIMVKTDKGKEWTMRGTEGIIKPNTIRKKGSKKIKVKIHKNEMADKRRIKISFRCGKQCEDLTFVQYAYM